MKYFIVLLLLIILPGCNDNPGDPVYNSLYFPLSVGNKWEYTGSVDMTIEVVSFTPIKGRFYHTLVRYFPEASDTMHLRYDRNDRLMICFEEEEYLFIDFTLPEGSTWDTYYSYYGVLRGKNLNSIVQAGIFNGVTEILFENYLFSDIYELNRYAPGVGMVSSLGFRRHFELRSAVINGISYP
jgi:hypothetical protein